MSPADPLRLSGLALDLSGRLFRSGTVAASPALAAETVICSLSIPSQVVVTEGVVLAGFCAFTVGASGDGSTLKLRQTGTSGTVLVSSGIIPQTAADLVAPTIIGFDSSPTIPGQVYVLTLTIPNGAAESEVSAAELIALVV